MFGTLVFSNGLNCFIVLISLYIGSFVGIGQIMHTVLVEYAHTEVNIYIKTKSVKIRHFILEQMGRGSTYREAKIGFTYLDTSVICTIISKYELMQLLRHIHSIDKGAFVVVKEHVDVDGNFFKKL